MLLLGAGGNTFEQVNQNIFSSSLLNPNDVHRSLYYLMNSLRQSKSNKTLDIANRLYVNENFSLEDNFTDSTKKCYGANVTTLDFVKVNDTLEEINSWIDEKTNGRINKMVSDKSLNSSSKSLLVNGISFHGKWKSSFDASNTRKEDFVILNPNSSDLEHSKFVKVDMMKQKHEYEHCYPKDIAAEFLKMPFEGDELSMLFALPKEIDGINDVLKNISKFNYSECFIQKKLKHEIDVELPKFDFKTNTNVKKLMQNIGVQDMFDSNKADFPGIDGEVSLDEIVHDVVIKINEAGSVAGADAKTQSKSRSMKEDYEFHVDRPFLFMITENHYGTILFIGKVVDPTDGITINNINME